MGIRFRVAALAGFLALTACAGGPAPRETFHRLDLAPVAQSFATPPLSGVLTIDRVEAEGALSGRAIAYQSDDGGVQRYLYQFWSDEPGLMLQDSLAVALRHARAATQVVTPDLRVPPDFFLKAKLKRFEHLPTAGKVSVRLEVAVVTIRTGALLLLKTYEGEAPASADPASVAPAMDRALGSVLTQLVADIGQISPETRP